jgi:hypothetical protein
MQNSGASLVKSGKTVVKKIHSRRHSGSLEASISRLQAPSQVSGDESDESLQSCIRQCELEAVVRAAEHKKISAPSGRKGRKEDWTWS